MTVRKETANQKEANPTTSKSDFVRSFPNDTPAAEVVDAAAKRGLKLTDKQVYSIRWKAKVRKAAAADAPKASPAPAKKAAKKGPRRATAAAATSGSLEDAFEAQFGKLVLRIGLDRAKGLLGAFEQRLTSLLQ